MNLLIIRIGGTIRCWQITILPFDMFEMLTHSFSGVIYMFIVI